MAEVLGLGYDALYKAFFTKEREAARIDGEFAGVLPLELHYWLQVKMGYRNLVWVKPDNNMVGQFHTPDQAHLDRHLMTGRAIVGVILGDQFTGHWVPVKYGMYKPYRYSTWRELDQFSKEDWTGPVAAILLEE